MASSTGPSFGSCESPVEPSGVTMWAMAVQTNIASAPAIPAAQMRPIIETSPLVVNQIKEPKPNPVRRLEAADGGAEGGGGCRSAARLRASAGGGDQRGDDRSAAGAPQALSGRPQPVEARPRNSISPWCVRSARLGSRPRGARDAIRCAPALGRRASDWHDDSVAECKQHGYNTCCPESRIRSAFLRQGGTLARLSIPAIPALPLVGGSVKRTSVEDRYTPELIIGMVGPIGSGVSTAAALVASTLKNEFGYTGTVVRVSDILNDNAGAVGELAVPRGDPHWTEVLQRIGTKLREQKGEAYVADLAVGHISLARVNSGEGDKKTLRRFTIIDSIKNPAEVARLSHVYGQAFWLIGVFAPEEKRKERLRGVLGEASELTKVMEVDENEDTKKGQRVRDTIFLSDYFIRNDGDNDDGLKLSVMRFLDVIFGVNIQTPTRDESAMYSAASAAAKGACLSRQVGAVILNKQGEVIGTGNNDVPRSGRGLYSFEDAKNDNRCYKWKEKRCHNDHRKEKLKDQIINSLLEKGLLSVENKVAAENIIFSTDLKQLIEFSRAVHAEMEAIISVASGLNPTFGAHG